ncbi:hypothetical protein C9374_007618 [Naegleria lovaniensis]|uniref:Phospholipid-transporting ATPase n=1 Tax=Naegleria lovaniensis TaxID=51637 RepID=A0AA88GLI8_NAELO|nr:uncharacterized protein C9374_007618 [Naegleria lovaniensis]KAG2378980.1 hypothetical protein C9374_007618 [Naegleria lovaniensis]
MRSLISYIRLLQSVNYGEKWRQFNDWLPWNRLPPAPRVIHLNDEETNQRKENKFCDNSVSTAKYNLVTFVPKNLLEQFKRVANIYFLLIALLQLATPFSPTGRYSTAIPLVIVIIIQMIKDGYEDIKRHLSDNEVNNRNISILRNGQVMEVAWKQVRVGDIVKVNQDESFPADLIGISSSEHQGICYIETSQLDGETNLKIKRCVHPTSALTDPNALLKLRGVVNCEQPNNKLYNFTGNIKIDPDPKPIALDVENILLRGAILKNTKHIYGLVVFTGKHSKLMMNSRNPPSKRSKVEKITNRMILLLFVAQLLLALFSAVALSIWQTKQNPSNQHWYFRDLTSAASQFFGALLTFFILYNNCIPISLYVTLETVKVLQARLFLDNDIKMCYYDKQNDMHIPALAKTSSLNEELGQVEYIFSDKTGTLTQNVMEFLKFSVSGVEYGRGSTEIGRAAAKRRGEHVEEDLPVPSEDGFQFVDERIMNNNWRKEQNATNIQELLTLLAVCHTVIPEVDKSKPNSIEYQASSPDEAALVKAAMHLGFVFKERTPKQASIEVSGVRQTFDVLNILEFNSTRKRMSVIVRTPDNKIVLYTKGADNVIYERLKPRQPFLEETRKILEKHAAEGLRTLVCAKAELDPVEYERWNTEVFEPAELDLKDKKQKLADAAEVIEKNLEVVGTTAIEDKLQDEVPDTIATLAKANIKIWVLTGDKQETAINIGYACALLDNNMSIMIINAENRSSLKTQIRMKLKNAMEGKEGSILGLVVDGSALDIILERKKKKKQKKKKHSQNEKKEIKILDDLENHDDESDDGQTNHAAEKDISHLQDDADDPNEEPLRYTFLRLCMMCKSVICCRVSPLQKSLIVKLVKDNLPGAVTLAIGDGANDVSMIQAAHIGVGISGKEGLQAARAADYAIAQFKYLKRLLLIHGRLNYRRIGKTIVYSFYKNLTLQLTQFYFIFYNAFTGTSLYENFSLSTFNLIFTSLPIIFFAMFDRDVNDDHAISFPELYTYGQKDYYFNIPRLLMWILNAIWHSICCFFIPMGAFAFMTGATHDGRMASLEEIGILIYTCIILLVNSKLALETSTWNVFNSIVLWGSVAVWFLWTIVYSFFYWIVPPANFFPFSTLKNLGVKYYFNFYTAAGNPLFWATLLLVMVVALGRDVAWKSAVRILPWTKQLYHILQPFSKVGQMAPREEVEHEFDFSKLQPPHRKPYDKFNRIGIYITPGAPIEEIEKYEPRALERKKTLTSTQFGTGYAFSQRENEKDLIEEIYSPANRVGLIELHTLDELDVKRPELVEEEVTASPSKRQMKKEMKSKLTSSASSSSKKKKNKEEEIEDYLDDEIITSYKEDE